MLWMTTMSIQGKMRIATIFNSGSGSETDGNGKGDNLGVGEGPGGQDDLELDDVLRACYRDDCFRVQAA